MSVDFYWTLDGDIAVGESGDIADTSYDLYRSLWQEIRTRCQSERKDWAIHPNLGANLSDLLGQPSGKLLAEEGKTRIINSLTQGGYIPQSLIRVRYLPIGPTRILYDVGVTVGAQGVQAQIVKAQLLYDTEESSLRVV